MKGYRPGGFILQGDNGPVAVVGDQGRGRSGKALDQVFHQAVYEVLGTPPV